MAAEPERLPPERLPPEHRGSRGRRIYRGARAASAGLEMGLSVLVGYGGGWWIDGRFDTGPWGMILGIGFGFAAGVRSLWRSAQQINAEAALDVDPPEDQ